jgi:hypothetical protein
MIPNTPENVALLNDMARDNVGPGREPEVTYEFDAKKKELYTYDFALMRFLGDEMLKELEMSKNKNKPRENSGSVLTGEPAAQPLSPAALIDDAASIRRINELNDKVEELLAANADLSAKLMAAEAVLAQRTAEETAPPVELPSGLEERTKALVEVLKLWLRDHPNQVLRDLRSRPNDGSPLHRAVHLLLNEDGSLRVLE